MNGRKGLVLDANILIRAVFGQRVRHILEAYENVASFCSPDVCFQDARKYIQICPSGAALTPRSVYRFWKGSVVSGAYSTIRSSIDFDGW
jgi:hypothetical protein